jgi:hypothetical protein
MCVVVTVIFEVCVCVCVCVRERERERESYFTTVGLPPINLSWHQAP